MSVRPKEELKATAAALASQLAVDKPDMAVIRPMMEALGYNLSPGQRPQDTQPVKASTGHIGIYRPEPCGDTIQYVRDIAYKDKWIHFADIPVIPPKGKAKRIVLLGESVARGFLLDPEYTQARLLEKLINNSSCGEETFEVVDLAETNLGMEGIRRRYNECMALSPDMIILFAGNNWRTDMEISIVNDPESLRKIAMAMYQQGGIKGLAAVMDELFAILIDRFLASLHAMKAGHQTEIVFVIPEFNLLDWHSTPGEQRVTRLRGDGIRQWLAARAAAETAWRDGHTEETIRLAGEMTAIDPTHPLGYELMAMGELAGSKYEEARKHLEQARDTAIFCRTNSKPRIFSVIRDTILSKAGQYQIHVVDTPAVFSRHLNGKLPGRQLFFDYCHLSTEGIQVTMEAVAELTLSILTQGRAALTQRASSIGPEEQVQAVAHFFAALHNAHWGQSYEILYYHCKRSLEYDRNMAENMILYCDMMSRRTNNIFTRHFQKLVMNFRHDRYINALRNPGNAKGMELELVDAMIDAIKDQGSDRSTFIRGLRAAEHNIVHRGINLLEAYYHSRSYDEYPGTRPAYFQARDPQSRFFVPGMTKSPVDITITLRVPELHACTGLATILLNGVCLGQLEVSDKWSDHTIIIPGELIAEDINELSIQWPVPENIGEPIPIARRAAPDPYAMIDAAYYVFGEIYRFTAGIQAGDTPVTPASLQEMMAISL